MLLLCATITIIVWPSTPFLSFYTCITDSIVKRDLTFRKLGQINLIQIKIKTSLLWLKIAHWREKNNCTWLSSHVYIYVRQLSIIFVLKNIFLNWRFSRHVCFCRRNGHRQDPKVLCFSGVTPLSPSDPPIEKRQSHFHFLLQTPEPAVFLSGCLLAVLLDLNLKARRELIYSWPGKSLLANFIWLTLFLVCRHQFLPGWIRMPSQGWSSPWVMRPQSQKVDR